MNNIKETLQNLIKQEVNAINNIPIDGKIEEALHIIYQQVHKKDGKVVISGMGKAGQSGNNIATT